MLYYIFRFLVDYGIPGSGMWTYISFRALLALIIALVISAWFGERFIKYMKRKNFSETQRDPKIDPFGEKKINVPSMGGIIIIGAFLITGLIYVRGFPEILPVMILAVGFGVVEVAFDFVGTLLQQSGDGFVGNRTKERNQQQKVDNLRDNRCVDFNQNKSPL